MATDVRRRLSQLEKKINLRKRSEGNTQAGRLWQEAAEADEELAVLCVGLKAAKTEDEFHKFAAAVMRRFVSVRDGDGSLIDVSDWLYLPPHLKPVNSSTV